RPKRPTTLNLF
nr:Chain B, 11-mer peptide from C-jun-amino-terminal kinase interacting protein 1 [synthetic construct]1UKI_B Chain B, 11-mer peptide from C-jun-amino-terminal kinase interacting protein 1 [synthetic construct]2G01_F Chain F, C-jun-amino-terminal kinase-interacting protein 1 [synthetic construct]2G01_G Chain G, C-jun-amino-terminal kinase-interacting protein 1 [synthetic construct]2GMX_F Chain F, C-jun-amino-terminal kinase-interacting protein 1 [synthetic construct]2GMX_G Chain G, C-jun-amino